MRTVNVFKTVLMFCIGAIFFVALPIHAESLDSKGRDFFFAFQKNFGDQANLSLFISGEQNAQGTVEVPDIGLNIPFTVEANVITVVDLPQSLQSLPANQISKLGVKVTSDNEITIYGLNRVDKSTDAFLALPTDALGLEYIAMSYYGLVDGEMSVPSQIAVVGVYDDTEVTITPSGETTDRPAGVPFSITLDSGETFSLEGVGFGDLTGTEIKATAPVSVMSGAQCTFVPSNYGACDHLVEMMPPVTSWGTSFLTVPLATRLNGEVFRILGSEDNTVISINGNEVATINRGQVIEGTIAGDSEINATAPILVAQFSPGSAFDGVVSDPFMMLIPPSEQFLDNYTFNALGPDSGFENSYINIVIPTGDIGSLSFDGFSLDPTAFFEIGLSGFSSAQFIVPAGSHNITASVPFGIYVYGFGETDSYGYPGGMAFEFINPRGDSYPPNIKLVPMGDTFEGTAGDSEDLNLNGILDTGEDINGNSILDRRDEDLNGNDILDAGEDTNGNETLDRDTGVFNIALEPGAENLELSLNSFTPGTLQTTFTVTRLDPDLPAIGVLVVSDGAGNTTQRTIEFAAGPTLRDVKVLSVLSRNDIDLDNSSFSQTPDSVEVVGDETHIEWNFSTIGVDQIEDLGYEIVLKNPVPGETRLVTHRLELTYIDVNGNPVRTDLGEQSVNVLSTEFDVSVSTDKSTYLANEDVVIGATVSNLSEFASETDLRVSVVDENGTLVTQVALFEGESITANGEKAFSSLIFNTGSILEGLYEVRAELLDDQGLPFDSAITRINITTPADNKATAFVSTNKAAYQPLETVEVANRIQNISTNATLDGLIAITTVYGPDGTVFSTHTSTLPQLLSGGLNNHNYSVPLGQADPGSYRVELVVQDADGSTLALDETSIVVQSSSDTGAGLEGSISLSTSTIFQSDTLEISANVENTGNADLADLVVKISIVDPDTQAVIDTWEVPGTSIAKGGSFSLEREWLATAEPGSIFFAVLSVDLNSENKILASESFSVEEQQIDVALSVDEDAMRALVLLDGCGKYHGGHKHSRHRHWHRHRHHRYRHWHKHKHGHGNDKKCTQDTNGPMNSPSLEDQRMALEAILNEKGWSYTIVTKKHDFSEELRSGLYNAYALFSENIKLDNDTQKELKEAVFRGEGLLVAGDLKYRNSVLDDALGIKVRGKVATPSTVIVDSVEDYASSTIDLTLLERARKVQLKEATVVATYSNGKTAISHNNYGFGRSVYAGFDLLAQATTSSADSALQGLLESAFEDIQPDQSVFLNNSIVPVELSITNAAPDVSGQVLVTLSDNTVAVDLGKTTLEDDGRLLWVDEFTQGETKKTTVWLKMPNGTDVVDIEALLQIGISPSVEDYGSYILSIQLVEAVELDDVITELSILKNESIHLRRAHNGLVRSKRQHDRGKIEKALNEALKAVNHLNKADHPSAKDIHRRVSLVIRNLEMSIQ